MFDSFFTDEARRFRIPVACATALVTLIAVGLVERTPSMEQHLAEDISRSVLVDLPGIEVSVDGRDVTLTGSVESREERDALRAQVRGRWGVRAVNVSRLVVQQATPPTVPQLGTPGSSSTTPGSTISSATAGSATAPALTTQPSTPTSTSATTTPATPTSTTSPVTTTRAPNLTTTSAASVSTTAATTTTPTLPTTTTPTTTTPTTIAPTPAQQQFVEDSVTLILASPLVFARNAAALAAASAPQLDQLAELFKQNPDVAISVHSFTDNRGRPGNNLALSQRRADAVRAALVARGVAPTQLKAVGFGESQPVADNSTEAGRTRNRRIEIVVARVP